MKRRNIEELREQDLADGTYLIARKSLATTKHGKPYLKVKLQDRTGELEARVWDNADAISAQFNEGEVARVRGTVESFAGTLQAKLDDIRAVPAEDVDPSAFLPVTRHSVEEMWDRLQAVIEDMRDPWVKKVLRKIFDDEDLQARFKRAPAAMGIHHPWIGGLLEHVLSLVYLAKRVCPHYPHIDEDQVVFGAIMHDLGKIYELSYETSFNYTDEGRLVGHLVTGAILTDRAVRELEGFPRELELRLKHILLAHHGTYEFGSPKIPQTLEAELLHRLDDMDSKITTMTQYLEKGSSDGSNWTEYARSMGRSFFIGEKGPIQWADHVVELPAEGGAAQATPPPKADKQTKPAPVSEKSASKNKAAGTPAGGDDTLDLFGRRRGSN
ncbi:MAG: HD domain-containing protein [Chrysiogenetes bacterium]|nr:HD domain-containing protein [Chrysiogenetes bacterium]